MNKIKIPKAEINDILEDDNTIEVGSDPYKHDMTFTHYVCKKDDKYYAFTIIFSYNEGLQLYDDFVDAEQVEPKEVKTIQWVPVKS